ncbi:MAG: response regulator [Lacunisphaera sp.]
MAIPPSKSGDKIVVLVDDEFSYIDLLQQLLADHLACPVHGFTKPADALRAMPDLNVGMIITDYQMPDINGLQFVAEVQKINPDIPRRDDHGLQSLLHAARAGGRALAQGDRAETVSLDCAGRRGREILAGFAPAEGAALNEPV